MTPYPEILIATLAGTTNAVINTATDDTVLAAPGAGLRYRVYAISIAESQSNAVNIMRHQTYSGGTLANTFFTCSVTSDVSFGQTWYPQGLPMGVNLAIVNRTLCTVAALAYRIVIHHSIEPV